MLELEINSCFSIFRFNEENLMEKSIHEYGIDISPLTIELSIRNTIYYESIYSDAS